MTLTLSKTITDKLYLFRGQQVMLDSNLAKLYGVETKVLNQAVKRNIERFPGDFMFQLSQTEAESGLRSRSQFVTLKKGQNIKYLPYVFTEQGVAMISSVLKSKQAIKINIQIMRAFVEIRSLISHNSEIRLKLKELEEKFTGKLKEHDDSIQILFMSLQELLEQDNKKKKRKIGF
jgi:hypothetical protein